MRRGHDRVEVVVDRRVRLSHVVIDRRALAVLVGVAHEIPRADRSVGHIELHRPPAAPGEVQPVVGGGGGRESRLLLVDRGDQQPVDPERALRRGVDRIEAFHPALRDLRFGLIDEAHRLRGLLRARWTRDDRRAAAPHDAATPSDAQPVGGGPAGGLHRAWRRSDGRHEHGGRRRARRGRARTPDHAAEHRHQHGHAEGAKGKRQEPRAAFGWRRRQVRARRMGVACLRGGNLRLRRPCIRRPGGRGCRGIVCHRSSLCYTVSRSAPPSSRLRARRSAYARVVIHT